MAALAPPLPDEVRILVALPIGVAYLVGERIEFVNDAFTRIMRGTLADLLGKDPFSFVAPADVGKAQERYEARRRGEPAPDAYEITLIALDGAQVRVEIIPRALSPTEHLIVIRELGERVREGALLHALGEVSTRAQRERTVAGVLREAVQGVAALGYQVAAFRIEGDLACVDALAFTAVARDFLERCLGRPLVGFRLPLAKLPNALRAIEGGRALFLEDIAPAMRQLLESSGATLPPGYESGLHQSGFERIIIAPITVRNQPWGFVSIGAQHLQTNDEAALSLFASHVGAAIEVAESIGDLERQNARLEAVHAVAMVPADGALDELVPKLLEKLMAVLRTDSAGMYVVDPDRNELVLVGSTGVRPGPLSERYRRLPVKRSKTGELAASFTPHAMNVSELPEELRNEMAAEGYVVAAVVPLVVNGRLAGAVNLARKRAEPFTAEDLHSAEILAGQVALQVERTRLYQDVQRRVHDLSRINELGALIGQHLELSQVLYTAMRQVSLMLEIPNAFLVTLDEDGSQLSLVASDVSGAPAEHFALPVDKPSGAMEAVRTGKPVVVEDAESHPIASSELVKRFGHRSLLVAPLLVEGCAIGALVLGETRRRRRFSQSEIERAVTVANQLASAIDNARLYEEQRRRVGQLRLLLQMSQVITGSLDLTQILHASAVGLARIVEATDAFIWLLEGTELRGVVASAPELHQHFSRVRLPLSASSAAAQAIISRAPVRIEDASQSSYINEDLNAVYRQKSMLALPLMLRDVAIGAISIGDRRKRRHFTDDEVEVALLICRQIAVALDNARLFDDLKASYQELSRAQQELVKRERLAALGELSAVIAHEVRNPLGVIFNSLSSLKRLVPPTEDGRMLLDIVGEEAERLNRMVSDLLDFARPNEAQLRAESLKRVVGGAVEAASRAMPAPHVELCFEPGEHLPDVPVDAQMLRQAVVNLVVNAMQAMPRGGRVVVRTAMEERGAAKFARVEVEDDGPGIPDGLSDRIFQPFFTTRAAGSGLGLAVVKRIADAHHAEIQVRSQQGTGATFTLWLPM